MSDVSVLVPSFNHARYVERALRSIFAQTYPIKKLIVIDDGSKDESAAVIRSVLADCVFEHQFIERENRGLCATLNEGLARSDSEYFAYLGSDDIWLPSMLSEQVPLLEKRQDAVLAFSHAFVIDKDDNIVDRTDNWTTFEDGNMLPSLLRGEVFSSPGVVYRCSSLRKYGWNEDSILEDYELYLKLSTEGEFARNEKVLCGWRRHGQNASDDHFDMICEQVAAQDRLADHLGLDRSQLKAYESRLKFRAVAELVRSGHKSEAWQWFREHIGGSPSLAETFATFARLLVPEYLFQWNRRRKRRSAISKYGKLELQK